MTCMRGTRRTPQESQSHGAHGPVRAIGAGGGAGRGAGGGGGPAEELGLVVGAAAHDHVVGARVGRGPVRHAGEAAEGDARAVL